MINMRNCHIIVSKLLPSLNDISKNIPNNFKPDPKIKNIPDHNFTPNLQYWLFEKIKYKIVNCIIIGINVDIC